MSSFQVKKTLKEVTIPHEGKMFCGPDEKQNTSTHYFFSTLTGLRAKPRNASRKN